MIGETSLNAHRIKEGVAEPGPEINFKYKEKFFNLVSKE